MVALLTFYFLLSAFLFLLSYFCFLLSNSVSLKILDNPSNNNMVNILPYFEFAKQKYDLVLNTDNKEMERLVQLIFDYLEKKVINTLKFEVR